MKRQAWHVVPWPANSQDWWALMHGDSHTPYKAWLSREEAQFAADILNLVQKDFR